MSGFGLPSEGNSEEGDSGGEEVLQMSSGLPQLLGVLDSLS